MMNTMPSPFHMPVFQGAFFAEETQEALRSLFPQLIIPARSDSVRFLEFRFHLVGRDGERCIPEKYVSLHPDPSILGAELSTQGQNAMRDIAFAWVQDSLADQAVVAHPLPWSEPDRAYRMADRYLSLFWRPEFSVLAQEHINTFLGGDALDPLGEHQALSHRAALASVILPPAESAHQRLRVQADLSGAISELDWLWERMVSGDSDLTYVLDDPTSPHPLD